MADVQVHHKYEASQEDIEMENKDETRQEEYAMEVDQVRIEGWQLTDDTQVKGLLLHHHSSSRLQDEATPKRDSQAINNGHGYEDLKYAEYGHEELIHNEQS